MSRCPFYDQSKYGLNPKKKMCRHAPTAKVAFPVSTFGDSLEKGLTEIHITWICAFHASMIRQAKEDQITAWNNRDAEVDKILESTILNNS